MFNLEWLKNLIKPYPTDLAQAPITNERAERIQHQVAAMEMAAIDNARAIERSLDKRLTTLERRSESVDAFYIKTVTQALSERQDRIGQRFQAQLNQNNIDIGAAKAEIYERMDKLVLEMVGRIDQITSELRQERERINDQVKRHAALVSKLRAGLE